MDIGLRPNDPTFDYRSFADSVHIIGIGGIGSHIARHLAKGGFQAPLHLWDGDRVEAHNRRNQTYRKEHIGLFKTAALARQIDEWSDGLTPAISHTEFVDGCRAVAGIVFLCVDKMSKRKVVWETCIKGNSDVPLFIETRMDGINILIHVLNPCDADHQQDWECYWYPDEEAVNETAGCGGPIAVLPSASISADVAVWQLMRYAAIKAGQDDILDNQIRVKLRPLEVKTYQW